MSELAFRILRRVENGAARFVIAALAVLMLTGVAPALDLKHNAASAIGNARDKLGRSGGSDCETGTEVENYIKDGAVGDLAYAVTWRSDFQDDSEPDQAGWLVRLYCFSGAYNFIHNWFLVPVDGDAVQLAFAQPSFTVRYVDDSAQSDVREIAVNGMVAELELTNSDFDESAQRISMFRKWRGLGDASSSGSWAFTGGSPILKHFKVDGSFNGKIDPLVIYAAE
ncbi:MAG: DUF1176 domain-containing protein [Alphaproteobacteria bacterium]